MVIGEKLSVWVVLQDGRYQTAENEGFGAAEEIWWSIYRRTKKRAKT